MEGMPPQGLRLAPARVTRPSPGPVVTRERLADILGPDADGDQGRENLAAALHRLRGMPGAKEALVRELRGGDR